MTTTCTMTNAGDPPPQGSNTPKAISQEVAFLRLSPFVVHN